MKSIKMALMLLALLAPWTTGAAQEFSPTQGYRLEISDGLALEPSTR